MWAVSAAKSASGYPMLFVNPHLPWFGFSQMYEAHLRSDEAKVLEPYLTINGLGYTSGARTLGGPGAIAYTRSLRNSHIVMHAVQPCVTNWDYERVFRYLGPDDFAAIDAPYLGYDVKSYTAGDLDHKKLIMSLKYAKFRWLLCEYPHPVYLKTFGKPFWSRNVHSRMHPRGDSKRTECMWKNY
jgi:hypothetical protein